MVTNPGAERAEASESESGNVEAESGSQSVLCGAVVLVLVA